MDIKALILCNNPVAIPAIKEFLFYGKVAAIAVTRRNKTMQQIVRSLTNGTEIPLIIVTPQNYEEELLKAIEQYEVNVGLMMTFPFLLTEKILQQPAKGFVNFHYGLLPECRGPQPILWHMLHNDKEAGVTVHKVDGGIDTGEIIMQERMPIDENDTYGMLQSKLAQLSARPASNLLKILSYGTTIPSRPQDEAKAGYYEMPTATDLTIKWDSMTAASVKRLINACNPWNKGAGTTINDWTIGVTAAEIVGDAEADNIEPGTILHCDEVNGLIVKTADNKKLSITIVYLQEGFYTGHRMMLFGLQPGMRFQ